MTNLFKVRLNKNSDNFESLFQKAYQDIYDLAKKVCTSKKTVVQEYLNGMEEPWITLQENSITFEVDGYTTIHKNDAQESTQIEYDFGKRSPTDDSFIFAIMCIFYHHIPGTEFYTEVDPYEDSFDDGVILARLVNDAIKNPFLEKLVPTSQLEVHYKIQEQLHGEHPPRFLEGIEILQYSLANAPKGQVTACLNLNICDTIYSYE